MSLVTYKYTPEQMPEVELRATFTARQHTLDYLVAEMYRHTDARTLNSYLVTGPRGSGKTTLLRMLRLRIRDDAGLSKVWLPIAFPEEQFDVASVRDLLAAILKYLSERGVQAAADWLQKVQAESDDEQSEQLAITGLTQLARLEDRRFVLFVENLDHLFENTLIDDRMKGTLRRLLMTDPFMMIVGSAVHVFESLRGYDEAFFNYFCPVPLGRLSDGEVSDLLRRRAEYDGNRDFLARLPQLQAGIKTLSHLSGGNPRLILMLYELLSQHGVATVLQQLHRLVDELTPLLKHELENLPAQQQKVIHALMEKGGTAQPTDLTKPTRMSLNAVTTQLSRLKEAQVLELRGGGKGRRAFYTVPDPLFAIWYQMRYLRQQRHRVEMFVRVIEVWFDAEERLKILKTIAAPADENACLSVHDSAASAEYFAAALSGTPYEETARDLALRQWLKAGDMQSAALAHAEFLGLEAGDERTYQAIAYEGLGEWSIEHDDPQTARLALQKAALQSTEPGILIKYGAACLMCGFPQEACDALNRAIHLPDASREQISRALISRAIAKGTSGDTQGEIADYTTVIEMTDAPKDQVTQALFNRGITKGTSGDTQGEIADYTTVIEMTDAPKDQVTQALFNRGITKGTSGDTQGAIADFTALIEISNAPKDRVAEALFNRGVAKGRTADTQGEIADYTTLIEMTDAPKDLVAEALFNRGITKGMSGDTEGAIADYTTLIEMTDAPKHPVAKAFVSRGVAKGRSGDTQGATADFTTLIEMTDAPKDLVAEALFNRGIAKGMSADTEGAIADYTTLFEITDAPKDLVAKALYNRGSTKGMSADTEGAIADFTTLFEMTDAPKDLVAKALYNRGSTKGMSADTEGAIADFTALIEMSDAPKDLVAKALFNRGCLENSGGQVEEAILDWGKVIQMIGSPITERTKAAIEAVSASGRAGQPDRVRFLLASFVQSLDPIDHPQRIECLVRFLSDLARPETKEAWSHAWHALTEHQPPEVADALKVFKPASQILGGADRSILDPLPPEERAFAERILERFDPAKTQ